MRQRILILLTGCLILSQTAWNQTITGIESKNSSLLAYQFWPVEPATESQGIAVAVPVKLNRNILDYVNEMRQNPGSFYHKYVEDYIKRKSSRFTGYYTRSLKKAMLSSGPLPVFEATPSLKNCAGLQLNYLSQFGGHQLSHEQGTVSFAERMKKAGLHCLAENLYAADDPKALAVVIDLLIDQHVPSLGHRLNLMNPAYTHIGIVSGTPKGGRTLVVMDFGCKN